MSVLVSETGGEDLKTSGSAVMALPPHFETSLRMAVNAYAQARGESFHEVAQKILADDARTVEHVTLMMAAACTEEA